MSVEVELAEGIMTVRVKRAEKRNALSSQILSELGRVFGEHRDCEDIRVAILIGDGDRAFASGGDVKELMAVRTAAEAQLFSRTARASLDAIRGFPVPVIAALNGDALGGGAELALACDQRIAAPHARIGFLQATLAISTAWGGGLDLYRQVGTARALYLLASGKILSAEEGAQIGLIDRVAPESAAFASEALAYARVFAARPRQVLCAHKALALALAFRAGESAATLASLETEQFAATWTHDDHWAAVARAFPPR